MMPIKPLPSVDEVCAEVDYWPLTGDFFYRKSGRICRSMNGKGYKTIFIKGEGYAANRLAWLLMTGEEPADLIDHIDRNKSNNAWHNLRPASFKQNCENRTVHSNNKLKVRGIRMNFNKYEPRLMHKGKAVYLGLFDTLEEAVAARKAAEVKFFTHGEQNAI